MNSEVLERSVIHAGKTFIKAGEENSRAYMIQQGLVRSFTMKDEEKIEVGRHGPGAIIGEICLLIDDPIPLNYEALVDTTMVTITRQDFQKKVSRVDKTVRTVLNHIATKLNDQISVDIQKALRNAELDSDALALMQGLLRGVGDDKRGRYEKAILPHLNGMIKELKSLKKTG